VDQDPDVTEQYRKLDIPTLCGDIADEHIQELAGITSARLVISTIPHIMENETLINAIQKSKHKPRVIITAQDEDDALALYGRGIDYVLLPHFIGGVHLAKILEEDQDLRGLKKLRTQHLKSLGT
jgi:Trk K+ transport system NAD-binding subunit